MGIGGEERIFGLFMYDIVWLRVYNPPNYVIWKKAWLSKSGN